MFEQQQLALKLLMAETNASFQHSKDYFIERNDSLSKYIAKANNFDVGIAQARKVFRMLKFIPGYIAVYQFFLKLYKLQQSHQSHQGKEIPSITLHELFSTGGKFFMANYFLFDTLNWLAKVGVLFEPRKTYSKNESRAKTLVISSLNNGKLADYGRYSNYSWFYGLLFTIAADAVTFADQFKKELNILTQLHKEVARQTDISMDRRPQTENTNQLASFEKTQQLQYELDQLHHQRNMLLLAFLKNFADMGIAANLVNLITLNKGYLGVCGVISGVIGWYELWPKK
jgi:hypothetical protein